MKRTITIIAAILLSAGCSEPDPVIVIDNCWAKGVQVRPAPPDSLVVLLGGTALVFGKEVVQPGCPDPGVRAVSFQSADTALVTVTQLNDTSGVVSGKRVSTSLLLVVGRIDNVARGVVIVVVR